MMLRSLLILLISTLAFHPVQVRSQDSTSNNPSQSPDRSKPDRHRDTEQAKAAIAEGRDRLFKKGDTVGAIQSFKRAVKLDPWYAEGYMMLGVASMQAQQWGDAQWAFEEVSKIDPDSPQAFLGIGSALNEQEDYKGAQKALEHSLALKPDSAEAHYELGRTLYALEQAEAAQVHARRAIELNKAYVGPHILMGYIYLQQRQTPAALTEFQEALRLDPEGPQAQAAKDEIARIQNPANDKAAAPKKSGSK